VEIDISALVDEMEGNLRIAFLDGNSQRRVSELRRVRKSWEGDEVGGGREGTDSTRDIDISSPSSQDLHCLQMSPTYRPKQRCGAILKRRP
jgi:hypothetical protein